MEMSRQFRVHPRWESELMATPQCNYGHLNVKVKVYNTSLTSSYDIPSMPHALTSMRSRSTDAETQRQEVDDEAHIKK